MALRPGGADLCRLLPQTTKAGRSGISWVVSPLCRVGPWGPSVAGNTRAGAQWLSGSSPKVCEPSHLGSNQKCKLPELPASVWDGSEAAFQLQLIFEVNACLALGALSKVGPFPRLGLSRLTSEEGEAAEAHTTWKAVGPGLGRGGRRTDFTPVEPSFSPRPTWQPARGALASPVAALSSRNLQSHWKSLGEGTPIGKLAPEGWGRRLLPCWARLLQEGCLGGLPGGLAPSPFDDR